MLLVVYGRGALGVMHMHLHMHDVPKHEVKIPIGWHMHTVCTRRYADMRMCTHAYAGAHRRVNHVIISVSRTCEFKKLVAMPAAQALRHHCFTTIQFGVTGCLPTAVIAAANMYAGTCKCMFKHTTYHRQADERET